MRTETLRPQDVLVVSKIFTQGLLRANVTYAGLAEDLGLSTSTVHESVVRCRQSQMLSPDGWQVMPWSLRVLLISVVPMVFYAVRGGLTSGMPTATHARGLEGKFRGEQGPLVVWCEDGAPEGLPRGEGLEPLYPMVPAACRFDEILYELLALADVMRIGNASERTTAVDLIDRRLFGQVKKGSRS